MTQTPPLVPLVLRQDTNTVEGRAVAQAAMLLDIPLVRVAFEGLAEHREKLAAGALPVGSVEFVREAMRVASLPEPEPLTYPKELDALLGRRIDLMPLERVRGTVFVKPAQTKLFTGFVWREAASDAEYDEHDLEQLRSLRALPGHTQVWVSQPVRFDCEWRYYVLHDKVIGAARYDPDGHEDAPAPDAQVLQSAVAAMAAADNAPAAYAVDLGVLDSGVTVCVEVNDGWALGLYGRSLDSKDYLRFLGARWNQVRDQSAREAPAAKAVSSQGLRP